MSNFDQVPKDFLTGIKLVLHTFGDPENPVHGELLHIQLRYELFYTTYGKVALNPLDFFRLGLQITDKLQSLLKNEEEFLRLGSIVKPCQKGWLDYVANSIYAKPVRK